MHVGPEDVVDGSPLCTFGLHTTCELSVRLKICLFCGPWLSLEHQTPMKGQRRKGSALPSPLFSTTGPRAGSFQTPGISLEKKVAVSTHSLHGFWPCGFLFSDLIEYLYPGKVRGVWWGSRVSFREDCVNYSQSSFYLGSGLLDVAPSLFVPYVFVNYSSWHFCKIWSLQELLLSKWCCCFSRYMDQPAGVVSDIWSSPPRESVTKPVDFKCLTSPRSAHRLQVSAVTLPTCLDNGNNFLLDQPPFIPPVHSPYCNENTSFHTQFWSWHPLLKHSSGFLALRMKTKFLNWPVKIKETPLLWPLTSLTPPVW